MMKWTEAQRAAIISPRPSDLKSQSLLVAAAAGSGKTAVLVERIITRLQDEENPIAINELLVLTFTKAAAEEMKSRIGLKLAETYALTQSPYLEEQIQLLPSAHISTLHSFCQWMIRNYFYQLDLDPACQIASTGQIELLKAEVIDALIQRAYEENLHDILNFADMFSSKGNDILLKNLILKLFSFSQAMENPQRWLNSLTAETEYFLNSDTLNLDQTPWGEYFWQKYQAKLELIANDILTLEELFNQPLAPHNFEKTFNEIKSEYLQLEQLNTWDEVSEILNNPLPKFTALRDASKDISNGLIDETLNAQAKSLIKHTRDLLKELRSLPLMINSSAWREQLRDQLKLISSLTGLTLDFAQAFKEAKTAELLLDFNDLEHYALELLTDYVDENGQRHPSKVALELQKNFKEIMLDEYQDTNGVQEAICNLVSRGDNCFYVGDVKQSIYRFRMADPSLFIEKYKNFSLDLNAQTRRIDLSQNFRSHPNILAATNFIFNQIMSEEAAELEYGEAEALNPGRLIEEPPPEYVGGAVEVCILEKNNLQKEEFENEEVEIIGEDFASHELEADFIAKKILELKKNNAMVQNKDGSYRPLQWSDIVILTRSISTRGSEMSEVLKSHGIPNYVSLRSGYFDSMEVKLMLCLLHIIDNPRQDLALASVLRSPLVGIDSEVLASLRLLSHRQKHMRATLYEDLEAYMQIKNYARANTEQATCQLYQTELTAQEMNEWQEYVENNLPIKSEGHLKIEKFWHNLEQWRSYARQHSVSKLIWNIFKNTDYVNFVSGLKNGKVRRANVLALYERAKEYEAGNFRGLFRFLRFLESLREAGEDLPLAQTISEADDVVRIMTIHQSKGLEFPIVFLANAHKNFNMADLRDSVLLHKEAGMGLKGYFPEYRIMYPSLTWLYVAERLKVDLKAEEERILYVALTRAKDKLFIVGSIKSDFETYANNLLPVISCTSEKFSADLILNANSYLDWIMMSLSRHLEGNIIREAVDAHELYVQKLKYGDSNWKIEIIQPEMNTYAVNDSEPKPLDFVILAENNQEEVSATKLDNKIIQRLTYKYPHELSTITDGKTSVTEIKRRHQAEDENANFILPSYVNDSLNSIFKMTPSFIKEKSTKSEDYVPKYYGAAYGTLIHSVMEKLEFKNYTPTELTQALDNLLLTNYLTKNERKNINEEQILAFFNSSIGQRAIKSNYRRKEWYFSMLIPSETHIKELKNEQLFLQGVIDLAFLEDEQWVLVDYKTDKAQSMDELWQKYQVQLDIYAQALVQLTGKKVKEKSIYSFRLNCSKEQ